MNRKLQGYDNNTISKQRESGIELLKVLAIFLIVISHVCMAIGYEPTKLAGEFVPPINLKMSTRDVSNFILGIMRHFGALGNNIFFICSFWFLCDRSKITLKRVLVILLDIWVISMLFLCGYLFSGEHLSISLVITSLFPTTSGWYWFTTCYLLMYLLHPLLNLVMANISQKTHLLACLVSVVLYCGIAFADTTLLFNSYLVHAIILYFIVGYMKRYLSVYNSGLKGNFILLLCGFIGLLLLLLATNEIGLHISPLSAEMHRWSVNNNPFLMMIALSSFNLFRQIHITNKVINYFSSLTLFIYVIHGNVLFRSFTELRIWNLVFEKFGYDHLILKVLIYATVLFIATCVLSVIYKTTLHKGIDWICGRLSPKISSLLDRITDKFLKKQPPAKPERKTKL